jgi:hypothetical protein
MYDLPAGVGPAYPVGPTGALGALPLFLALRARPALPGQRLSLARFPGNPPLRPLRRLRHRPPGRLWELPRVVCRAIALPGLVPLSPRLMVGASAWKVAGQALSRGAASLLYPSGAIGLGGVER